MLVGAFVADLHLDGIDVNALLGDGRGLLLDFTNNPANARKRQAGTTAW